MTEKIEKISLTKTDKQVPTSFLYKRNIKIQDLVKPINRFLALFPKEVSTLSAAEPKATEKVTIASLFKEEEEEKKESDSQIFPIYEPLESRFSQYPAPDLQGKGKLPDAHAFFPESHRGWNIDNLSIGQIRQLIDMMFIEYKLMCLRGKSEIEACKTIIQCFTGTLLRWWEIESSPNFLAKMEAEVLKDETGDVNHNPDGTTISNMIGALTSMILEHWCRSETEIQDKNEVILMNLKCHKMS